MDVRERAARSVFQLVSSFLPVDPAGNTEHEVLFIPSSWDGRLKSESCFIALLNCEREGVRDLIGPVAGRP